jgi:uncharacterized protein (DUF427 family)
MPKATWRDEVITEDRSFEEVDGNVCFAPGALRREHLRPGATTTVCAWKGTATYHGVGGSDQVNVDAPWTYVDPTPAAENNRGRVGFWKGVTVTR